MYSKHALHLCYYLKKNYFEKPLWWIKNKKNKRFYFSLYSFSKLFLLWYRYVPDYIIFLLLGKLLLTFSQIMCVEFTQFLFVRRCLYFSGIFEDDFTVYRSQTGVCYCFSFHTLTFQLLACVVSYESAIIFPVLCHNTYPF